jgi:hypothetical protein
MKGGSKSGFLGFCRGPVARFNLLLKTDASCPAMTVHFLEK